MSRIPGEFGKSPNFAFANREAFKDMAADDAFPRWLRVTFAAYGEVSANGHAVFRQRILAGLLGDNVDGVWTPTTRQRVREAIDGAIDRGLLLPESKALCLIVPRHVVAYGLGEDLPCKRHPSQKERQNRVVSRRNDLPGSFLSDPKERQNRVVSGSRPLFSLQTPTDTEQDPAC